MLTQSKSAMREQVEMLCIEELAPKDHLLRAIDKAISLTCFIALTMLRLIQHRILKHHGKLTNNTEKWEAGLSAERIQNALRDWQADPLPGEYFRTTKPSADLKLILDALQIDGGARFPIEPELRKLKLTADMAFM